jgi:two-component system sensor histidine kinase PilS (NtrC family)
MAALFPQGGGYDDSAKRLLRAKLGKLLLYRLILAVLFLVLTLAVQLSRNADLLSSIFRPLYVFACILFLFTVVGALCLNRIRNLERFAWVQIIFDLSAVTVLVYMTGGIESSFSSLYMLVIISSALLLKRRASLLSASACTMVYGLLLELQYFERIFPLQLISASGPQRDSGSYFISILMNTASFFLVAFLAGYLAEEVHKSSQRAREREKDLSHLATLHKSIVQSMSSGLLTVDLEGSIIFSNNAAESILGVCSADINGRSLTELFPSVQVSQLPGIKSQSGPKRPSGRMETEYSSPQGVKITVGYSASILQNENGEAFGWTIIFTDLTRLKAIQEHIQRMERLVMAGTFAAEVAHEIKNPLAAISGAMQMLRGEMGQNPLHEKLMGIVQREIERINTLVSQFLWMAKDSPKSASVDDVAVCSVVEEIIALLRARNQVTASHVIQTDFIAEPLIRIDPNHLQQVFWNLFVNALEAMPKGGELSISVELDDLPEGSERAARIDVRDTGDGIPEEIFKRIFDPFFTTKSNGTGLGLSIVYQLVEKAGGKIEVSRPVSENKTVFSVFFPISPSFSLAK